jgi:glycerol-3-phosphate acyltransferase PlsY
MDLIDFRIIILLYLVATYLISSIPFGLIIGKLFGKDVRKEGSGNIGATNVTRVIGKKAGFLVLILDMAKGYIPTAYAFHFFYGDTKIIMLVAITAIIGHCFSVFLNFKGGKGVATAFGVMLALSPKATLVIAGIWIGTFLVSGYVSLSSILAAFSTPVIVLFIEKDFNLTIATLIMAVIIITKHSSNIKRLVQGNESRFLHK